MQMRKNILCVILRFSISEAKTCIFLTFFKKKKCFLKKLARHLLNTEVQSDTLRDL